MFPAGLLEADSGCEQHVLSLATHYCVLVEGPCPCTDPPRASALSCGAIALCHSSALAARALTSHPDCVSWDGSLLASPRRATLNRFRKISRHCESTREGTRHPRRSPAGSERSSSRSTQIAQQNRTAGKPEGRGGSVQGHGPLTRTRFGKAR